MARGRAGRCLPVLRQAWIDGWVAHRISVGGALVACAVVLAVLVGCQWNRGRPSSEPPPKPVPAEDPILAGTVGALTYLANVHGQPVRGFGIVIGLGANGSSDCPTTIREHLVETMIKEVETWGSLKERQDFSANKLINSPTTAVVEIAGIVPAGARAGTAFDIQVRAIPGTATRALTGGLLLPCELRVAGPTGGYEELLGGPVVARAAGPVFVSPFAPEAGDAAARGERRGDVLSGGHTTQERTTRLLLREPSYPLARQLQRRINERFGLRPQAAEAMSRGYLTLHTPRQYAERPHEFIQLVMHVPIEDHPAVTDARLRELARLIVLPGADYEHICLAWEGIGRTAIASLQPLYSHRTPQVRFYAARAGLRLGDVTALPIVSALAASVHHALALLAAGELGRCPYPQAAVALVPLLDRPDHAIRIAAYEALLKHRHPAIRSRQLPMVLDPMQLNLVLDIVACTGQPLLYVRRTRVPRIAVFVERTPLTLPLFYADTDDSVTLNANDDTGEITLFTSRGGKLSAPILVPPRVVDLISALGDLPVQDDAGRMRGAGLPFSQVLRVLSALCRNRTIQTPLEIERVTPTTALGPQPLPERPETDELPAAEEVGQRPESKDIPAAASDGPGNRS